MKTIIFLFSNTLFGNYVTCEFPGQLGNQLFQIAATISYALKHDLKSVFPGIKKAPGGKENLKYIFPKIVTTCPSSHFFVVREKKIGLIIYYPGKVIKIFV